MDNYKLNPKIQRSFMEVIIEIANHEYCTLWGALRTQYQY